ncbi:MAG: putative allantoicase [Saprospiraceae bacterium]|nr:MAG: putative allantoicase [Saprospiraceae bacterium]
MHHKKEGIETDDRPSFVKYLDLAAAKLGGNVLYATDDFFAEKENLIKQAAAIFIPDKYTDRGKWMDGWESRRKRTPGHDWCIVQLAVPGRIKGFDIDTSHFLGNHPPFASIEAVKLEPGHEVDNWAEANLAWTEILAKSPLNPGSHNYYASLTDEIFTHLKLHIYPDGGVARLRVFGEVHKDWSQHPADKVVDLVSAKEGGKALHCNDMFFSAMDNLIMPDRGVNMGDGWETKRNRTPNNRDWVILRLAHPGCIEEIIVDTCHFKGNYPDSCSIEACFAASDEEVLSGAVNWQPLLPKQQLSADKEHSFKEEVAHLPRISHVRLNIFPDGGISRLRLMGRKV